jgi:hypothetical protein
MNEFGEFPSIYVSPKDHEEGTAFPEDFNDRLSKALTDAGIDWEWV